MSNRSSPPASRYLYILALTALGVVFGDIGTSPLYALRICFYGPHALAPTAPNVLGVVSLILWSLVIVISVKYLVFVMRADNRGEGGILALLALVGRGGRGRGILFALGIFGAALLYGDGVITPAISVLSAVEGLAVATPVFWPFVIPITIVILVLLFSVQSRGTAGIGVMFGPVMLIWFVTLAILGVRGILREPAVLLGASPLHAVTFFAQNRVAGFVVLGAVFLVVTGGEALYADMGHVGRRAIRLTWVSLVLPALLLNYFGQGALLIVDPTTAQNPFYHLVPPGFLYPLVGLATGATVIASQALISGAFSLTRQAVQLGYCPRVEIRHTSAREIGQIYIPGVNWALMIATIGLVLGFHSSSKLAAAYGVAVSATMAITTILFAVVARQRWNWKPLLVLLVAAPLLLIDLAFLGANLTKVTHGGWFPIVAGGMVYVLLTTWKRGRGLLAEHYSLRSVPLDLLLRDVESNPPPRVSGVGVFMAPIGEGVPPLLLHHLKHNKVLHQRVIVLTVVTEEIPHVPPERRVAIESMDAGFYRVAAHYGFMQDPDIAEVLTCCNAQGWNLKMMETTFYLGRMTLIVGRRGGMAKWRKQLFAFMTRNARSATAFFRIPPNRVVELGAHIRL